MEGNIWIIMLVYKMMHEQLAKLNGVAICSK